MFPSYVPVYDPQISLGEYIVRNVHVSRLMANITRLNDDINYKRPKYTFLM